jgi:hypothetical protein
MCTLIKWLGLGEASDKDEALPIVAILLVGKDKVRLTL